MAALLSQDFAFCIDPVAFLFLVGLPNFGVGQRTPINLEFVEQTDEGLERGGNLHVCAFDAQ